MTTRQTGPFRRSLLVTLWILCALGADRRHGQLAGVNTGDIDQVANQAIHSSDVPVNALSTRASLFALFGLRGSFRDQCRGGDERAEQVTEVVTHDAEKVVPMRDVGVGANTFGQQMTVCLFPLQGQERHQDSRVLLALASQRRVGPRAFLLKDGILQPALFHDGGAAACRCRTRIVLVFMQPGLAHNRVGQRASVTDDLIRVVFSRREPTSHYAVEIAALGLQAVVGMGALA